VETRPSQRLSRDSEVEREYVVLKKNTMFIAKRFIVMR